MPLADLDPSVRRGSSDDHWSTSRSSSNEDILSTTVWEPDPSSESEHLVLLHPVVAALIMRLPQRFSTTILRITPKLGVIEPFAVGAMVSMLSSLPSTWCLSECCPPTRSIRSRSPSTTRARVLPRGYFSRHFTWYVCENVLEGNNVTVVSERYTPQFCCS